MNPVFDYHALAPALVLSGAIVVVLVADLLFPDREGWQTSRLASLGLLLALVPVVTLAIDGTDRSLFGGAFVVDDYALAFDAFFLLVAYVTVLVSVDYIGEGDYYKSEFYFLLLSSVLGMVAMASARDMISIFVALELISIPTFVLAGWRKHDAKSNEAAIKYYLIGVLSSAVMLYGMSLIFGLSGGKVLLADIGRFAASGDAPPLFAVAIFLTLVGFAFKVSAVPFHFWAPDTYEGSPTPVTAFLSVASKAGGFVAILSIIYFGFFQAQESWQPVLWALAAASMTVGNLTALRQTNIVRMLAYSSIAQGGFILVPLAVAQDAPAVSFEAVVIYILIYGAMNLGAFAVVIAVARRTRSGEITSYAGLGETAPVLGILMSMFLLSLAGIPPLAGWFAKFVMFRAVFEAGGAAAVTLGVIAAVNSVIAFFYYAGVARRIWFEDGSGPEPAAELTGAARVPPSLMVAMAMTAAVVLVIGVYPQLFARVGELAVPL